MTQDEEKRGYCLTESVTAVFGNCFKYKLVMGDDPSAEARKLMVKLYDSEDLAGIYPANEAKCRQIVGKVDRLK